RASVSLVAAQIVFGAYLVGMSLNGSVKGWSRYGGGAPKSPLYGIWNVDEMIVNGQTRSPLVTDYGRWRRVVFQNPTGMSFQRMNDTFVFQPATIDVASKSIALTKADKSPAGRFSFEQPAADRLILDGNMDGHAVRMQ